MRLASEQLERPPWEPERLVGAAAAAAAAALSPLEAVAASEPIFSFLLFFSLRSILKEAKLVGRGRDRERER